MNALEALVNPLTTLAEETRLTLANLADAATDLAVPSEDSEIANRRVEFLISGLLD